MRPAVVDREIGFALDRVCKMGDDEDQFAFWNKYAEALYLSTLSKSSLASRYPTLLRRTTVKRGDGSTMIFSEFTEADGQTALRISLSWAEKRPGGEFMARWGDEEIARAVGVNLEDFGWLLETTYREVSNK